MSSGLAPIKRAPETSSARIIKLLNKRMHVRKHTEVVKVEAAKEVEQMEQELRSSGKHLRPQEVLHDLIAREF